MESITKIGEVQLEVTGEVKTSEELKVMLLWGWGAETTGKLSFNPSEDLKVGDGLKVTIEKVVIIPDPIEEEPEEVVAEAGECQEAVAAGEGAEPSPETEGVVGVIADTEPIPECECSCTCTAEEGEQATIGTEGTDKTETV
ncbi:MAG: hypothetical protein WC958_00785 [Dehalococcoidales bacterium]